MHQHGVAGSVPEGVVDLLEAVEVDVEQRQPAPLARAPARTALEGFVEVAPVGQAGEAVVQRIVLDPGPCGLEFGIARLRKPVGLLEVVVERHIRGDVPVDADDLPAGARIGIHRADGPDVAHLPRRSDDAVVRTVAAGLLGGDAEFLAGPFQIVRMQPVGPVRIGPLLPGWPAVEFVHPVVPDQNVGVEVELPHADPGSFQRQAEPPRQAPQFCLAAAQRLDVALPLLDDEEGDEDQPPEEEDDGTEQPGAGRQGGPAIPWNGGDLPRARRQGDVDGHRIVLEHVLRPEEPLAQDAQRVLAGDGDLDGKLAVQQPAAGIEPLGVDDGRNQAPEAARHAVFDINREAADEAAAALHQIDRAGEHQLAAFHHPERRVALRRVGPVIEADGRFVAFDRVDHGDDQIGRRGNVAQQRLSLEQPGRQGTVAVLVHAGFGGDRRHQAAHQLQVAADGALQLGADHAYFFEHLGADALAVDQVVLGIGEIAGNQDDQQRTNRRQPRGPQQRLSQISQIGTGLSQPRYTLLPTDLRPSRGTIGSSA